MALEKENLKPPGFCLPQKNNSRCFLWNGYHKISITHAAAKYQLKLRVEQGIYLNCVQIVLGIELKRIFSNHVRQMETPSPLAESIFLK